MSIELGLQPLDEVMKRLGLNGRAFLAGMGKQSRVQARWTDGECKLTINYPSDAEDLPELGTLVCR